MFRYLEEQGAARAFDQGKVEGQGGSPAALRSVGGADGTARPPNHDDANNTTNDSGDGRSAQDAYVSSDHKMEDGKQFMNDTSNSNIASTSSRTIQESSTTTTSQQQADQQHPHHSTSFPTITYQQREAAALRETYIARASMMPLNESQFHAPTSYQLTARSVQRDLANNETRNLLIHAGAADQLRANNIVGHHHPATFPSNPLTGTIPGLMTGATYLGASNNLVSGFSHQGTLHHGLVGPSSSTPASAARRVVARNTAGSANIVSAPRTSAAARLVGSNLSANDPRVPQQNTFLAIPQGAPMARTSNGGLYTLMHQHQQSAQELIDSRRFLSMQAGSFPYAQQHYLIPHEQALGGIATTSPQSAAESFLRKNTNNNNTVDHTSNASVFNANKVQQPFSEDQEAHIWMRMYNQLKSFKEEFGHTHVPINYKVNIELAQWVNDQRQFYREFRSSGGKSGLSTCKATMLEKLGFACKKKPGQLWMTQFNLLKKFKEKHGHCHVPMHYKHDKKLGHWVNNQRQLYRKWNKHLPTSMNESRVALLNGLGFAWVLGKDWKEKRREDTMNFHKTSPSTSLEDCETEKAADKHFDFSNNSKNDEGTSAIKSGPGKDKIPSSPMEKGEVSAPSNASDHSNEYNKSSIAAVSTIEQKTSLNVEDDEGQEEVKVVASRTGPERAVKTEILSVAEETCGNSRLKRKHLRIPEVEFEGRMISHVLFSDAPGQFDIDEEIDTSSDVGSQMEIEQIQRAAKRPRANYNTDKHWNKRFDDLVQFKAIHGHCHVPFQSADNKSLSYWVSNQRQKFRQFQKGEESTLNQERIDALLSLGFKFNVREVNNEKHYKNESTGLDKLSPNSPSGFDAVFNTRLQDLKKYKMANGDCLVPAIYAENRQLGTWVGQQRQAYRKYLAGENSSLTREKISALFDLGFCWKVGRGRKAGKKNASSSSREVALTEGNHICLLDDKLLFHVLGFLLDIKDITFFSSTSKSYHNLLRESTDSNRLLMNTYMHTYGSERLLHLTEYGSNLPSFSWLDAWKDMPRFVKALEMQTHIDGGILAATDPGETAEEVYQRLEDGLGILSTRKESQAILKDNADLVPSHDKKSYCAGYSGMIRFYIRSENDTTREPPELHYKSQIAVWGDFEGIRFCNSAEELFSCNGVSKKNKFHSVGEARFGRVSTIIPASQIRRQVGGRYHPRRPCLYLGCVSGAVVGIFPIPRDDQRPCEIEYGMSAMAFAHSSAVTALSVLPTCSAIDSDEVLISAGLDGKVHLYPNSFSARHQFEVHSRIMCCENKAPILALASRENKSSYLIFTGDKAGKIIMWKSRPGSRLGNDPSARSRTPCTFEPIFTVPSMDSHSQITRLSLFKNSTLVSGNNSGDLQVWDVVEKKKYHKKNRKIALNPNSRLRLGQRFMVPIAHPGGIVSLSFFGEVLLSTGGNDGFTKAWSMKEGALVGTLIHCEGLDSSKLCSQKGLTHTEKRVFSYEGLKAAIMSIVFCDRSMITISRDGSLCRWRYGQLLDRHIVEASGPGQELDNVNGADSTIKCKYCHHIDPEGNYACSQCHEPLQEDEDFDEKEQFSDSDASDEGDDSDTDNFDWKCSQCQTNNTISFTKCSKCNAWRSAGNESK